MVLVPQKYVDIFGSTIGFWFFGYAVSGNTTNRILGEEQDYIFWFFRVSYTLQLPNNCMFIFNVHSSHLLATLPQSLVVH